MLKILTVLALSVALGGFFAGYSLPLPPQPTQEISFLDVFDKHCKNKNMDLETCFNQAEQEWNELGFVSISDDGR